MLNIGSSLQSVQFRRSELYLLDRTIIVGFYQIQQYYQKNNGNIAIIIVYFYCN